MAKLKILNIFKKLFKPKEKDIGLDESIEDKTAKLVEKLGDGEMVAIPQKGYNLAYDMEACTRRLALKTKSGRRLRDEQIGYYWDWYGTQYWVFANYYDDQLWFVIKKKTNSLYAEAIVKWVLWNYQVKFNTIPFVIPEKVKDTLDTFMEQFEIEMSSRI